GGEGELGQAVEVEIVRTDADAAAEGGVEGEEVAQQGGRGNLAIGLNLGEFAAADDLDVRAAADAGADDDIPHRDVLADSDVHAAAEDGAEREETAQDGGSGDLAVGLDLA